MTSETVAELMGHKTIQMDDAVSQEPELEHQIRLGAYELYEARGRKDGHQLEDWLRAEEEIKVRKVRTVAA